MDIYTIEIGKWMTLGDGSKVFLSWIELDLYDDIVGEDKWLSLDDPKYAVWPLSGEWNRPVSNKQVILRRRDAGPRLARLHYKSWPWRKGAEGLAELDETFDGEKNGVYVVTKVQ